MISRSFNPNRWKLAYSMIRAMIVVTIPAALSLWCMMALLDQVRDGGGLLTWSALIIITPFALILTAVAATVDFFSVLGLIATLLSRKIKTVNVTSFGTARPRRTVRDVTPEKPFSAPPAERLPESHPD